METIEQLRAEEAACLTKFRARAAKLAASNPGMSQRMLFARACEQMPKVLERYMYISARLRYAGIEPQPLR
jgi:hypothetical protein